MIVKTKQEKLKSQENERQNFRKLQKQQKL